jgi:hypothetical protein
MTGALQQTQQRQAHLDEQQLVGIRVVEGRASSVILKRASAFPSSGEWNDDDFDVRAVVRPHHRFRI